MAQKTRIVLYGAGGHGKVVADAIEQQGDGEVVGFLDDTVTGSVYGYPVLGGKEILPDLSDQNVTAGIVTMGNSTARQAAQKALCDAGITIATAVHPTAYVARGATIGEGTAILPKAVIGADAAIGIGCIINTGATVDHDCTLGDFVHIAPGAHLAGEVRVGEHTHVGIGTSIKEGISIGSHCMIGAGSVVIKDVTEKSVAYGTPAKHVRDNDR